MTSAKKIIGEALKLPEAERAEVAQEILASLEAPEPDIERAWAEEIRRRSRDYDEGKVKAVDARLGLRRIRARLKKLRPR